MARLASSATMLVAIVLWGCGGGSDGDRSEDTTAPTVSLDTAAATVARTVALGATAADDRGVASVEFLVDGTAIGSDSSAPFEFNWNTALVADGAHMVTARALDEAGNSATSTAVSFVVQNQVSFAVVLSGAEEIPGTATIAAGTATLEVNLGTGALGGSLVTSRMTATAAHIHAGFAGQNGPVVVGLAEDAATPGTWEFAPGAGLTAAQVDALLAGGLYLNAHSATAPAGEVRGQIVPPGVTVGFANLVGLQEVPAVATGAAGQGGLTVNRSTGRATIHVTTRAVVDPTAAHLHEAPGGRNGPVLIPLTQDGSDPRHWFAVDQAISAAAIAAFDAGGTYLNVHTAAHESGEVRGQVTPPDVLFVANRLDGGQEVPAKTTAGQGTVAVTVNRVTRGLVLHANVTGVDDAGSAHIHEAYAGQVGSVIVPLEKDAADPTHWSSTGAQLTETQFASLAKGKTYVNVHTPANPGGEIRGQLVPPGVHLVPTAMSGAEEDPPVVTTAAGNAWTTVDLAAGMVSMHVHATGVDDATDAHIHAGPRGTSGPPFVTLVKDAGDPGHWAAEDQAVDDSRLQEFLAGLWYVNVHTPANPTGEIRGQVEPELPVPPDTTAPAVTLAALPATVSGMVVLSATSTDDVAVASVRFLVNGTEVGADSTAPYSVTWDTTTVANAQATIGAEAIDTSGNSTQAATISVMVDNAPAATTLTELQASIFGAICSVCHTGGGGALPASMNLSSAAASYAALVNVPSEQQPAVLRVDPGDAAASYLVRKLEGTAGIGGVRMPLGGPFLSPADIDKVKSWINAGALNN